MSSPVSRRNAGSSAQQQPLPNRRHYQFVDNRSALVPLRPAVREVAAAHPVEPVVGEVVAAESRLTVEQFAMFAPGDTVMRVTATEVVVHSSAYLEPHRLPNTVRDSGVGHARWVDAEPTPVAPSEPQRSAQQIDAVYGAWTRDSSDTSRLLGSL